MRIHAIAGLLACSIAAAGCSSLPVGTSFEVAVGANVTKHMPWSGGRDGRFAGPTDTVRFTVRHDISDRAFCAYNHISHLSDGWPVNNQPEDWLDNVECGLRFGKRRD